ncbi:Major royal jelly protein [Micromonospora echinaurantiaca]|uniref:Major royal jelly protein n=1 Tax=Micromonospora echinaurantiaca TaxID=47857 RepID=A0A1C5HZW5_9ACTN|nr:L-dopachrome tautomerase-related protein [Micromonospora echinaurantiaca]SCG51507.1 Major royal jelly protein [Micromonospora echinaurantiaca]
MSADWPDRADDRLTSVHASNRIWNGVTTAAGRTFVCYPNADGPGIAVAELRADGTAVPYPDPAWNAVRDDHDPDGAFVTVNSLRTGPDGLLWLVDSGAPGFGAPPVPGGPRLLAVDLATDRITRCYDLTAVTRPTSFLDDVRFNGPTAYLTDAGAPALVVLDLASGRARRVLDGHWSTTAGRPMSADGTPLRDLDGAEVRLHADQLEVSPDGAHLYFQPACGPLARVATHWLDDPDVPPDTLAGAVERWLDTPSTGGTAIDADGAIYLSDVDRRRILRIAPDRQVATLVADPRLAFADALWIDRGGDLLIPVTQLHRTAGLAGGRDSVERPLRIYRWPVGARPAPNDHP